MSIDWSSWILEKNLKSIAEELKKASFADVPPKAPKIPDSTPVAPTATPSKPATAPPDPADHYRQLHPDTHAFLTKLSQQHGSTNHNLADPTEAGFEDDVEPGDVAMYHDFGDVSDGNYEGHGNYEDFQKHMDDHYDQIKDHMKNKGYYLHDDNDGSGGGLHYGSTLWRQDPNFRKPKPKARKIEPEPSFDIQEPPEAGI